jgi:hypothetical protein
MNELTDTGRVADGRITAGMKGIPYDVYEHVGAWDPEQVLDDDELVSLLATSA